MTKCLIVIPARLKATRLPNKPLAMIGDAPMIVQVWRRAVESGVGEVVVACDGPEIYAAITEHGGRAFITDPELPSGSDRIWEVVKLLEGGLTPPSPAVQATPAASGSRRFGATHELLAGGLTPPSQPAAATPAALTGLAGHYDIIINLQGDVPTLEPRLLKALLKPLENHAVDIATLAAPITRPEEHVSPAVVKAVLAENGRALYFSRAAVPANDGPRYHHIGVYAYRRDALAKFVSLPPSPLEQREKLEQLRALEAGMRIDAVVVDTVPLGVDTAEDLERARELLANNG